MMPSVKRLAHEWPTWCVLIGCYAAWLAAALFHESLGWIWIGVATLSVTLHSSLQHEALHGHPTGSASVNEALVFPAVGLLVPYGRFHDLHLKHHNNAHLTDPYDDPESCYVTAGDWSQLSTAMRTLLAANGTLAGRFVFGPALAFVGMIKQDMFLIADGDRRVLSAWLRHAVGIVPIITLLNFTGISFWFYLVFVAYPGMSVLMIRTFIEHRAVETVPERTAVVEAGWLMRLLFLNNNFHAVHHRHPGLSWYKLPAIWRRERDGFLSENGHYHFAGGYIEVARNWLFRRREPLVHPFLHTEPVGENIEHRSKQKELA